MKRKIAARAPGQSSRRRDSGISPGNSLPTLAYAGKQDALEVLQPRSVYTLRAAGSDNGAAAGGVNRLILGDNAAALRLLLQDPSVAGQVALCYIDPPFATGNDFRAGQKRTATISKSVSDRLAYEDRLAPAEYVEFLRQRLILLHALLSPRGCIWVHIGHQMAHYVRVLLDEVFGREHFVNEIARVKCNPKNFARSAFGNIKDTLLFYSKSGRHVWNDSREELSETDLTRLFPRLDQTGRRYATTPLHAPGETRSGGTGQPWRGMRPPAGRHWRYDPAELDRLDRAGLIEWSPTGNPRKIVYAEQIRRAGKKRQDIWTFKDPAYPRYPTEKNLELLKTIIQCCTNPGDLVLDCFAGSGTTLVAAADLERRWIGIDASKLAIRTCQSRLTVLPAPALFQLQELRLKPASARLQFIPPRGLAKLSG